MRMGGPFGHPLVDKGTQLVIPNECLGEKFQVVGCGFGQLESSGQIGSTISCKDFDRIGIVRCKCRPVAVDVPFKPPGTSGPVQGQRVLNFIIGACSEVTKVHFLAAM